VSSLILEETILNIPLESSFDLARISEQRDPWNQRCEWSWDSSNYRTRRYPEQSIHRTQVLL